MTFYGRIRISNNILEGGTFLLMIHSQYRTGGLRYTGTAGYPAIICSLGSKTGTGYKK